jgi:superfamily II DNA helicase RecQ
MLQTPVYHAGLTEEERPNILTVWQIAALTCQLVLIATTALSAGVDCVGVRLVIHIELSYTAIDYA